MKLLAFSDVHLDSRFGWADSTAVGRRHRGRLRSGVAWAFEQAREKGTAAVLIAGDLFEHEYVSADTVEFLRRTFENAGRRVFVAPGNHDHASAQSPWRQVDWPANVHVFRERHLTPVALADGVTIWGAAHVKPVDTPGFFDDGFGASLLPDAAGDAAGAVHIAVFHGEERSAAFQGEHRHAPFEGRQIGAAGLDHAVVGHSHAPKDHSDWTRLGSLEQLRFNERHGSAVVLEVDNGRVATWRLAQRPAALHVLKVDLTGMPGADEARKRVAAALSGLTGAARVRLVGEPDMDDLRAHEFAPGAFDLPTGIDQLDVDTSGLAPSWDLAQLAAEQTVRGAFVRRLQGAGLGPETERQVLLAGLRALDGREIGLVEELRARTRSDEDAGADSGDPA